MLNAGIIARVSTDQQNDKGSLDIQIDKNLKYCNANNINPVRIYKQVISGGNGEVLKTEVRNDIESGLINCVVMWEISRIARVASWILNEIDHFISKRIKVIIVTNPTLDVYNANDKFMLTIQSGVAEFGKAQILERSITSMEQRKDNGERMAGTPPLGYTRVGKNHWEKNEKFDEVLNAFEVFNKIDSANKTAKLLGWSIQTLISRLTNVTYIGKNNFRSTERKLSKKISWTEIEALPPLNAVKLEDQIPLELFKSAYLKIVKNSEKARRGINNSPYLLSGLIRCSCGGKFAGAKDEYKGKDYSHYRCIKCLKSINKNKVETAVIANLKTEIEHFDDINKFQVDIDKLEVKREKLYRELEKAEAAIKNKYFKRLESLDEGRISKSDFDYLRIKDNQKTDKIKEDIKNINLSLEQLNKRSKINNKDKLKKYINDIEKLENIQDKKKVFRILIDGIIVHSEKHSRKIEIDITYNF